MRPPCFGARIWWVVFFFFSSRRRHTRLTCDWSSDVCSSDLARAGREQPLADLPDICVAVATTLVVWQIGKRWLSPGAGILAGLAVALHPYLVWHDVHMNREILDHFLAAVIVYLTLHVAERPSWRRALPLGAAIGLGILGNVRLEALPLVLGAYLLWRTAISHRTALAACALVAGAALLVMPWVVRNGVSVGC